jgi:protein-S-isoprenylcysteine O-methyltransferase Ste14
VKRYLSAIVGTVVFLVLAPGLVVGLVPWALLGWHARPSYPGSATVRVLGLLAIVVGAGIVLDSFARFALQGSGTPAPIYPTDRLIVTGLYRHVRNPMYVGVVAVIGGEVLWFGRLGWFVYGVIVWLAFHLFILFYEEPTLHRTYGAQFATYCANVRRWWPRLTPWRDASTPAR